MYLIMYVLTLQVYVLELNKYVNQIMYCFNDYLLYLSSWLWIAYMIWLLPMYPTSYFVIFPPVHYILGFMNLVIFPLDSSNMLSLPQGHSTWYSLFLQISSPSSFLALSSYSSGLSTVVACLIEVSFQCFFLNSLFLYCT